MPLKRSDNFEDFLKSYFKSSIFNHNECGMQLGFIESTPLTSIKIHQNLTVNKLKFPQSESFKRSLKCREGLRNIC